MSRQVKHHFTRFLSLFMMAIMVLGYLPHQVLAQDGGDAGEYVPIQPISATLIDRDVNINGTFNNTWPNRVGLIGRTGAPNLSNPPGVSPMRYSIIINGARYEVFCVDPHLPGPENQNAPPYRISHTRNDLRPILRYGFPTNSAFLSTDDAYSAYATRIAIALAASQIAGFGGELVGDNILIGFALSLVEGGNPASLVYRNRVLVNGQESDTQEGFLEGGMVISEPFQLSGVANNPVRITAPAGVQILSGSAGNNPVNLNNPITSDMTFRIAAPEGSFASGDTVSIDIRGVNYEYAGQVWAARTTSNPDNFQEMVFYIPRVSASASMFWIPEVDEGRLRIIKLSQTTNQGLAGAIFRIEGPYGFNQVVPTPPNGIINLTGLEFGEYTITEIEPPYGYYLSEPTVQTITVEEGNTAVATVIFRNRRHDPPPPRVAPPAAVRIQKIDAITRENIPDALMRIEGRSNFSMVTADGQIWEINNRGIDMSIVLTEGHTLPVVPEQEYDDDGNPVGPPPVEFELIDGVLTIYNLPWGYYRVQEERAPDGYSLLPQHTAYSFWLLPPNVMVSVRDGEVGGGIPDFDDGGIEAMIAAILNDNLGGPAYELPEDDKDFGGGTGGVEFVIDEDANVNSILITFENYPFSEIVVYKHCRVTNNPLSNAHIRIQGFFVEGNAPVITDRTYVTDSSGRVVFSGLPAGTYTISEVQAPPGFLLDTPNFHSVDVSWGQLQSNPNRPAPVVRFYNTPMSSLEVIKVDGDTGAMLDGAIFELRDPTTGETWQGTTIGGSVRLGRSASGVNELFPDRVYILTEIQPPAGYVLIPTPREVVLSPGDNNQVTIRNYQNPSLTIIKRDIDTQEALPGAVFEVRFENGQTVSGSPFTTGADGTVTLPWTLLEGDSERTLIITEIVAPAGYMLSDPNWQSVTMRVGENNVVTFYNTPLSSLEVIKIDGDTGAMLDGAVFELRDPTTGQTWQGTTAGGSVRLGQDANGVNELWPGRTYILTEIHPPAGYVLIPTPREVVLTPGSSNVITIRNYQNPSLTIIKRDIDTQEPLAGAVFEVVFENGQTVQGSPFTTGSDGTVTIPWTLFEGNTERTLIITEIVAPPGYHLASPNWQRVTMRQGEHNVVTFENARKPTITIQKRDAVTGMPIANAEFTIEKITEPGRGMLTGNPFRTDANGLIVLPFQYAGRYRIVETRAANNYWLDPLEQNRSWIIEVRENEDYLLIVENTLLPSLIITKWNALTMRPVPLTHFRVEFEVPNSGNVIHIGNFMTNQRGQIILPFVQSGWYRVTETRPAPGMALNLNNNYRVFLAPGQNTYTLMQQGLIPSVFEGIAPYPASAVEPPNIPEETEQLPPADNIPDDTFIIESDNPGSYVVNINDIEIVDNPALVSQLTGGMSVTGGDSWDTGYGVWNWPLNSIVIKKTDITNGRMLAGATFDLIHVSTGESGTRGTVIGTFTTNHSGIIVITGLEPGAYVVEEVIAPENYMLAVNNRQHAFLRPDGFSIVETHFSNYPFGSLLVTLRCEVTGQPIQNGEFRVTTSDGTVVGTANGLFRTNQEGYFLIPNLRPDSYVVTQLLPAPDGFVLGSVVVPQTIHVRPDGQTYRLEFTNQPLSTLIIRKIDSYDNSPIAGARYRVYRQDNSFVGEFLTDNQGLIEIPRLLGWFTVREVDVPHGFELDMQTVRTVQVQPHAPSLVTFYSPRLGSLTIEAVDEHGTPLAGATFRVNRQNGEFVGTYTTGASGVINIPNLTSGWYTVEATSAPNGFIIGEEGRSVEVLPNTAPVTRFVFPRLSVLTIEKVDDMGRPLAGATFEVRRPNGERIAMGTTNNAGVFVVSGITPGTVVIEETQAPAGFAIVDSARTVEFAPGQNRTERFRNYRLGTLVIENVDESHAPLQGGRFRVTRPNGEVVGDFLAPISGIITIPMLTSGAYIVEQIASPAGFVISDAGRTVEVLANQTVRTIFTNTRQPSLTIEKVDEDGNPLANAEFEVRRPSGELVIRVVTNNGGVIHVPNLEPGTFIIEETRAPSGFVVIEPARTIEIVAGQVRVERFVNYRSPSLIIEKVDADGNPLANAEFEVRTLGGELVVRGVTNQGGLFIVPSLEPGAYEVIETRAPQGFVVTEPARTINIVAGQDAVERFVNHRAPSLVIEKVDTDGNPLANAEFEVRRLNGELVVRGVTNQGGLFIVASLEPGAYEVIETRAPEGFVVVEPSRAIEIVAGQTRTERFVNYRAANLTIEKVDTDGNPLAGAEFEVRRPNGELIARVTTNNGGVAVVNNIEAGTIVITETRAPQGFVVTEPARTITVVAGQNAVERFVNHRQPSLIIEKVDTDGNPLANAEFEVRTLGGELVVRGVTNQGDLFVVDGLEPGAYEVIETRAPEGFVVVEPSRAIEIVAGQTRTERFVNYRAANLTIEKVDTDGNPLAGAEFEVRRPNGELIARVTTNNGGEAVVNNIEAGTIIIVETRAPQGFVVTEPARTITITAGQNAVERFVNHRQPSLIIEKVDTDGNPLAGAEFEVRTLGGQLVHRAVTNQGGLITIPYLAPGSYQLIETRAPEGFVVTEPARAIEILAGQTITERFVNHRMPALVIEKVDTDGNPLAGATFEVRTLAGLLVERVVTNQGGMAIIHELAPGSYEVIETIAPQGFALIEGSRAIQIVAGQTVTERFVNPRLATLVIQKVDGVTNAPLQGVAFEVSTLAGDRWPNHINNSFEYVTDIAGMIRLPNLPAGTWVITETRPLSGYMAAEPVVFAVGVDRDYVVTVRNYRYPDYNILKLDDVTGQPLAGVEFEIAHFFANGQIGSRIRNPFDGSFIWTTDTAGLIRIPNLAHGTYVAIEVRPLPGYRLAEPRIFVVANHEPTTITIHNYRYSEWNIRKLDGHNDSPQAGVIFEVAVFHGSGTTGERLRNAHDGSFEFVTDSAGIARIGALEPGTFIITETRPLPGFQVAEPVIINVTGNEVDTTVTIRNYRYSEWNIRKLDGHNDSPQAGVIFEVAVFHGSGTTGERLRNATDGSFEFVTDSAGIARIGALELGTFIITEIRPLPGFQAAEPVIITVTGNEVDTTVIIRNYRYSEWNIRKLDGHDDTPQAGVIFEIAPYFGSGTTGERLRNPQNGSFEFVSDEAGIVRIGQLTPGMYIITETRPLSGFFAADPVIITVTGNETDTTITIRNYRIPDFVIRKTDGDTGQPLAGVHFEVARYFGGGNAGERLQNPVDGSFTFITDSAGLIRLPHMEAGTFIAVETRALPGYILADPVVFVVGPNATNTTIDVRNYRQAYLTIQKINSITRAPLAGVMFEISRPDGTRLVNPRTGNHDFITDARGLIFLPVMEDGRFYLRETRALPGFIIDEEIIAFNIDSSARQREHLLVVENTPAAGLLVIARDAQTRRPLQGIEVEVRHADGRIVTGQMIHGNQPSTPANSPQLSANGNFVTDRFGRINLNHLATGVYHVRVINAIGGYQMDTDTHVVTVVAGQLTVLELESIPLGGFRLLHIDAITRAPIFNAEFMIFDSNNKVVGNFQTDNRGIIDFSALLTAGRYTIRMTRPAPGYSRDDMPRTIEFIAGRVTEIVWEAIPIGGQLQILKVSGDANQHNGLPAGTPLAGAIFEIFEARTGNLVDRIISNERGMAVSRPLPLGRYIAREVMAPAFYMINPQEIHFEIEHENQIVRVTFPNFSANVGVTIRKTGPQEAMQGHSIVYEIPVVRNESSIPLADFFWRDTLPTNAVRIDRLVTGTYNHALRYRVLATTNLGNTIIVADNLSTLVNNVIELRPVHLGLAANEYVVDITLFFGQVPAGFTSVERPRILVDVLSDRQAFLPDGMMFANKVDVGGRIPGTDEWVIGNSTTATTIFNPRRIPQSGW